MYRPAVEHRTSYGSIMVITQDHLRRVAAWSQELDVREREVARTGIVERSYGAEECIFMRGDRFDYWAGVVSGLARVGVASRGGKEASFASLTAGAWFGEGSVLKNEARRPRRRRTARYPAGAHGPPHLRLAVREQCGI